MKVGGPPFYHTPEHLSYLVERNVRRRRTSWEQYQRLRRVYDSGGKPDDSTKSQDRRRQAINKLETKYADFQDKYKNLPQN